MLTEASFRTRLIRRGLAQVGHDYRDSSVPTNWPPEQFDCSVFINWLCHEQGFDADLGKLVDATKWPEKKPRPWRKYRGYTGNQKETARRLGATIPFSEIKPGDFLYYGKPGAYHVVMYIGDGKVVHAAGTAYGVIVSSVVRPGEIGHGGKTLELCVSSTKLAKAAGVQFVKIPVKSYVPVKIGGKTKLHVLEVIRQSGMSTDRFLRLNKKYRMPGHPDRPADVFLLPGTTVNASLKTSAIVAGRDRA